MPQRKADSFREYLSSLGLREFERKTDGSLRPDKMNVQGSNPGLQVRNNMLMRNSCFASLAQRLYSVADAEALESLARGERKTRQIIKNDKPDSRIYNVFKMDESAGSNEFKGVAPGWFWEKALTVANGDTNLAIQLMGICTHDDWGGSGANDIEEVNDPNLNRRKIMAIEKIDREDPRILYSTKPDRSAKQTLDSKMNELKNRGNSFKIIRTTFSCDAQTTYGYRLYLLPGSIGNKFDIDNSLKEKIANFQSPTLGKEGVRSKYYHVYGALQSACILVRGGYPHFMVKQIAKRVARAYRANGICPDINRYSNTFSSLNEKNLLDRNKLIKILDSEKDRKSFFSLIPESKIVEFYQVKDSSRLADIILNYARAGQILKKGMKLDLIDCDKFQILGRVGPLLESMSKATDPYISWCRLAGVTDKIACDGALKVIKTWAVDFEWTEKQHELGATMATELCKYDSGDEDIYKSACTPWEKIKSDFQDKNTITNAPQTSEDRSYLRIK